MADGLIGFDAVLKVGFLNEQAGEKQEVMANHSISPYSNIPPLLYLTPYYTPPYCIISPYYTPLLYNIPLL